MEHPERARRDRQVRSVGETGATLDLAFLLSQGLPRGQALAHRQVPLSRQRRTEERQGRQLCIRLRPNTGFTDKWRPLHLLVNRHSIIVWCQETSPPHPRTMPKILLMTASPKRRENP